MGYTTEFEGRIEITPPLNAEEIEYLKKFNQSRRMHRTNGPYFAEPGDDFGQDHLPDIVNYNRPDPSQPGLWCGWEPTEDGTAIVWDGGEKFYHSVEWMQYLIEHFLKPACLAKLPLPFLQANHVLNGRIDAQGEEDGDRWTLVVQDNKVTVAE